MDKLAIVFFTSLIAVSLSLSPDEKYTIMFTAMWKELDENSDATLTIAEVEKGLVSDYDVNHGGSVTLDEFLSIFDEQEDAAKQIFKQLDTNKDNVWTTADFTKIIKSMDANGDGKVVRSEFISTAIKVFKEANFDPDKLMIVG